MIIKKEMTNNTIYIVYCILYIYIVLYNNTIYIYIKSKLNT